MCEAHSIRHQHGKYTGGIIRPVALFIKYQIVQGKLDDADGFKIHRDHAHRAIGAFGGQGVCAVTQSTGKYITAVKIRIFTDQIHAPGCKGNVARCLVKIALELLFEFC